MMDERIDPITALAILQKRHAATVEKLTAQRDQLLAALKAIIDRGDADSLFQKQTLAQARAVIAEVEGE